MPTVYIAARNSGQAIPIFKKKGIPDSMPGVAGEVPIHIRTRFFAMPARLFKYVIACIATNIAVLTNTALSYNAFKPVTQLSRLFEVPICSFRFKNLSPAEITELKGMGLQQDLTNANIFTGTPPSHLLARITAFGPIEDRIRPGHISYEGYYAWVYLMKGIQIYTSVRQKMGGAYLNILSAGHVDPASKGEATAYDNSTVEYQNAHMTMEVANFCGDIIVLPPADNNSEFTGSFVDIANIPKDSFKKAIFFPFFVGMAIMDKSTCSEVFRSLFSGCLSDRGADADGKVMGKVRGGCRQLAFSKTGMTMSHIYKVFGLSEEICGAKVHVVTKGAVYVGMIVEGDFSVELYGRITESGDISEDLGKVNLLDSQASEVAALLNGATDANGNSVYHFETNDFLNSRRALTCWNTVDKDLWQSSNDYEKAKGILREMEFNDIFPMPTIALIETFIKYVETGDRTLLDNHVAYLDGGILDSNTRVWEGLSMFGPKAPTCNVGDNKGTLITFPRAAASDSNLTKTDGVRPLAYFPFWVYPLSQAANQWTDLFAKGIMSVPKGRRNKKEFTDLHKVSLQIGSDPTFTSMYNSVKAIVNDYRRNTDGTGKRKRGQDDGEDKKGKKPKHDDMEDI